MPIATASISILEVEVDCDGRRSGCCEWRRVCGNSVAANEALAPYLDPASCLWLDIDGHGDASTAWTEAPT